MQKKQDEISEQNIVFFDGVCGLCNRNIDFLMRIDRADVLIFAPLQGPTASKLLNRRDSEKMDSIVYWKNGTPRERSAAILGILKDIGGAWRVLSFLRIIPSPIRDGVYCLIARNRYKWFGKMESCRLPTREEQHKFLD